MKKIAIITGASSGMGWDFAKELDDKNLDEIMNIVMFFSHFTPRRIKASLAAKGM